MKFVSSVLAIAVLAAAPALAFTDAGKKFTIDFPSGWTTSAPDTSGSVQSTAPGDGKVYCRANSNAMASLKNSTQTTINKEYSAPLDQATWAAVLSTDASKMKLIESTSRIVDGHVVKYATISFPASVVGFDATAKFASHIMVGRMVNAACFGPTGDYANRKASFDKITISLRPL